MRKCIYADTLIEILNKEKVPFNADVNYFILNAPDADVQEVKHGRWINDKFGSKCSSCGRYAPRIKEWFGSECGYPDKFGEPLESLYCPSCGTKMDGVKNEVN